MDTGPDGVADGAPSGRGVADARSEETVCAGPEARTEEDTSARGSPEPDDDSQVLLFMRPGRDRELVGEALGDRFRVDATTDVEALEATFNCCVFDAHEFNRVAGSIQRRRELADPVFLPFVLLLGDDAVGPTGENT